MCWKRHCPSVHIVSSVLIDQLQTISGKSSVYFRMVMNSFYYKLLLLPTEERVKQWLLSLRIIKRLYFSFINLKSSRHVTKRNPALCARCVYPAFIYSLATRITSWTFFRILALSFSNFFSANLYPSRDDCFNFTSLNYCNCNPRRNPKICVHTMGILYRLFYMYTCKSSYLVYLQDIDYFWDKSAKKDSLTIRS